MIHTWFKIREFSNINANSCPHTRFNTNFRVRHYYIVHLISRGRGVRAAAKHDHIPSNFSLCLLIGIIITFPNVKSYTFKVKKNYRKITGKLYSVTALAVTPLGLEKWERGQKR